MANAAVPVALARQQPPVLLAVSVTGWLLLVALDQSLRVPALCLSSPTLGAAVSGGFAAAFALNSPALLMLSWLAMLLAMMPPLLAQPIAHLWLRSLSRRRGRAIALFVAGYGAVWMTAGVLLITLVIALSLIANMTGLPVLLAAAAVVIPWQAAPPRQWSLNRCHRRPRLSAFGARADLDCISYGVTHGLWCVGACWALMLVPLAVPGAHLPLLALLSLVLVMERLAQARPACWTFRILPGLTEAAMIFRWSKA
jgi:predicted metal-binding membrane protein